MIYKGFTLLVIVVLLSALSCQEDHDLITMDKLDENIDCKYIFDEDLLNIYGTWEPKVVIDYETGDSTFYEIGVGHQGHMLTYWYADSFELRDNGEFDIFYTIFGRPCEHHVGGTWDYHETNMDFYINQDTINIPITLITENELIIEDVINSRESSVIMRRIN